MNEQNWSFDEVIDRSETQSVKWDFHEKDLLPLWVADMDFRAPNPIIDALSNRVKHGIFGYSYFHNSYYDALLNWFKRRYNWELNQEWLLFTPGVIPAINLAIQEFSNPGDNIIIQNPVYYPFYGVITNKGRQFLLNPLKFSKNSYKMDFEDLEKKVSDPRTKIVILCNPHNPIGRVYTSQELTHFGDICIEHEKLIIADEIHCDLVYPQYKHINFSSINEDFAQNSITCTSGSKTFNLAGLQLSNIIIPNQEIRKTMRLAIERLFLPEALGYLPNTLSFVAFRAAYENCEEWLDSLIQYLQSNLEFLKSFIRDNLPLISVIEPEGTYLVWLDFRKLGMGHEQLEHFMKKDAKVALDEGYNFGQGGEGFERINIACPRLILEEALNRIFNAITNLKNTNY